MGRGRSSRRSAAAGSAGDIIPATPGRARAGCVARISARRSGSRAAPGACSGCGSRRGPSRARSRRSRRYGPLARAQHRHRYPDPDALRYAARWLDGWPTSARRSATEQGGSVLVPTCAWACASCPRTSSGLPTGRLARARAVVIGVAARARRAARRDRRGRSDVAPWLSRRSGVAAAVEDRLGRPRRGVGPRTRQRPAARHRRMTAAPSAELLDALAERARETDLGQLDARLRASGGCARPIRLRGTVEVCDGHGRSASGRPTHEPDGVLRKACGNRREAVCPPCAERYRQDAYHLIAAGLRGGKGVPDTITEHPAVFLTLTAPSFGVVHTRPLGPDGRPRRCRPRRDDPVCPHGVRLSCRAIHDEHDPRLGEPLCPECFDYAGGGDVEQLARRAVALHDDLRPARAGRAGRDDAGRAQARGPRRRTSRSPSTSAAGSCTCTCSRAWIARCPTTAPTSCTRPRTRFDARAARTRDPQDRRRRLRSRRRRARRRACALGRPARRPPPAPATQRGEVAGYLAKYATKSTEQAGGLLHRIAADQVDVVNVREHVRSYMRTAFELDAAASSRARRTTGTARGRRRDRLEPGRARDPPPAGDGYRRGAACPAARRRGAPWAASSGCSTPRPSGAGPRSPSSSTAGLGDAPRRRRLDRPRATDPLGAAIVATRGWPPARTRSATAATA